MNARILSAATVALLLAGAPASAQEVPIDNSFLVEEAYNQGPGEVQHINVFEHRGDDAWAYAFVQEWPLGGIKHQLGFAVPVQQTAMADAGVARGLGDLAIDYRYQAVGDGDAPVAFAPRLTVSLPTGDADRGLGAGGVGLEANLPLSIVLAPTVAAHTNLGASYARIASGGDLVGTTGIHAGQSVMWFAHPSFNLMLEGWWANTESVVSDGTTERANELWISPGVRFAHTFGNDVQVVPGVGVPIGVGPSAGERQVILYLSVEHGFGRQGG